MGIIGFLAVPLGYVMRAIYGAVQNYGVAIILFTALVKVCLLPLTIHQQKSTAKMSVFSPRTSRRSTPRIRNAPRKK